MSGSPPPSPAAGDAVLFDELSRLNNELATMQRSLAKSNAELARLNEEKDRFLGMAAHDLRSPMSVILTYSGFLEREAGDALTGEHREFLAVIRSHAEFMLRLVNELLDITAIASGRLRLDLGPVNVGALLERTVGLARPIAHEKGIALALEVDDRLPPCRADAAKVVQVLDNLISNAVKYSPPGAPVEAAARRHEEDVVVSIRDRGPGIPAEERDRLFKPFSRTSVRPTGGEKSTGLGLAICQRIVAGHGGRIWVESEVGRGSTFAFALPVDRDAAAAGESP
ncbi:MAG: sensor histidine kinase [Acidobacteriota bacterium]